VKFEEICRTYFPRWHNAQHWKLQEGSRGQWVNAQGEIRYTTEQGYCDSAQRVIWVSDTSKVTLIHEICHAVTGPSHGKRFRARLRQAAQHAEQLAETALALALSQEADGYESEEGERITPTSIYNMLEDIVRDVPGMTYEQVVNGIAVDLGLTPAELHQRARRLHRVYETAQQEWESREPRRKERQEGS
jgi:hypothetical protein